MDRAIRARVLITKRLTEPVERALAERFEILNSPGHDPVSIGLAASRFDPHAIVVRDDLPEDICERAPSLLHVARHGVGLDVIPMAQCARHQVTVSNVPGGNATSVAEWCVAQMLALAHSLPQIAESMRERGWAATRTAFSGRAHDLSARQIGLIGCGAIGSALARMLHFGFGARVMAFVRTPGKLPPYVQAVDWQTCVSQADVLVPCVPLTGQTRGMVDRQAIAAMKRSAFLVNASRGEVIDETALIEALRAGRLAGAALDVIADRQGQQGDLPPALPNLVVTPHLAGHTSDAAAYNGASVVRALEAVLLQGQPPEHLIDSAAWAPMLQRRARLLALPA
ncbi:MAG TPA: NAD(P)-dependent oxidoreductase [Burkholderiaceae bacterium]|nr:NAD(P)-dependent oxidoreductase [Burkholderiaceae bacterium]